jgi:hypothetical protein
MKVSSVLESSGKSANLLKTSTSKIQLLGATEKIQWQQTDDALAISEPKTVPNNFAIVFKVSLQGK